MCGQALLKVHTYLYILMPSWCCNVWIVIWGSSQKLYVSISHSCKFGQPDALQVVGCQILKLKCTCGTKELVKNTKKKIGC